MNEWRVVFWITFVIFAVTTLIYCLWASGDLQPWNEPNNMKLIQDPSYIENNIVESKEKEGKPVEAEDNNDSDSIQEKKDDKH